MKTVLLAALLIGAASTTSAADLRVQFEEVCNSAAVKSEKLEAACQAGAAPDQVKAGDRFKNVGIGAEVNTLAANIAFFRKG